MSFGENSFKKSFKLLQYFDVSNNPIKNLLFLQSFSCFNIKILKISFTLIESIKENSFQNCTRLIELQMNFCKILSIQKNSFKDLESMKIFEFIETEIPIISRENVKYLRNLRNAIGDNFYLCCLLKEEYGDKVKCKPLTSSFESCKKLINLKLTSMICWFYGLIGFILNIVTISYIFIKYKKRSRNYRLLLSLGDLFMAVYLLIISAANEYIGDNYIIYSKIWKESYLCQMLGTIITVSKFSTVLSMLLMAFERYIAVKDPLKVNLLSTKSNLMILVSIILITFLSLVKYSLSEVYIIFSFLKLFTEI